MKILYEDVLVVGTQYREENLVAAWQKFNEVQKGKVSIFIWNESTNKADRYAYAVELVIKEKLGLFKSQKHSYHVGYLPKKMAFACAHKEREGKYVDGFFRSFEESDHPDYKYNLIIDVFVD